MMRCNMQRCFVSLTQIATSVSLAVFLVLGVSANLAFAQLGGLGAFDASSNATGGSAASGLNSGSGNPTSGGGGGAQADFSQIMALIQTTIEPDTWEALGGPSTLFPYPAGIYVDANGLINDVKTPFDQNAASEVGRLLAASSEVAAEGGIDWKDADAWQSASPLRCVSLKRVLTAYARHRTERTSPAEALLNVGGLSRVQYVWFGDDDIVIAGPVSGITSREGRFVDSGTGRATLRLDALASSFQAVAANGGFGCSIDPTTKGLQAAAAVAQQIQTGDTPIGKADQAMIDAIGLQDVAVFGTNRDSSLAWLLVEADRHMKQLALGVHPMPGVATNYLDQIERNIKHGLPTDLMIRLWFNSNPLSARSSGDGRVVELAGRCIKLSGENEAAVKSGKRGFVTKDRRTEAFVKDFNLNWASIRNEYPVYASLESVFESAALAQLINRRLTIEDKSANRASQFLADAFSTIASDQFGYAAPRQVESIAVTHSFTHGRKRHRVVIASGGVLVTPELNLQPNVKTYEPITGMRVVLDKSPKELNRWWWNG